MDNDDINNEVSERVWDEDTMGYKDLTDEQYWNDVEWDNSVH